MTVKVGLANDGAVKGKLFGERRPGSFTTRSAADAVKIPGSTNATPVRADDQDLKIFSRRAFFASSEIFIRIETGWVTGVAMTMILLITQSIGSALASLVAGVAISWALFTIFKLIRHPAWGPPLVVVPMVMAAMGVLPENEFARHVLVFAAAAAGPFWIAGLTWRQDRRSRGHRKSPADSVSLSASMPGITPIEPAI